MSDPAISSKEKIYNKPMIVFAIVILVSAFISWLWVKGIDNMQENYKDYKGDDFLDL